MPYMYILSCSDDSYYTGSTKNLEKRLWEHNNGLGANHTKKRLPAQLVYFEEYDRVDDAYYREKQVQGWNRKKKEALINGEFDTLPVLAKTNNRRRVKVASTGSATGSGSVDEVDSEMKTETVPEISSTVEKSSTIEKDRLSEQA